MDPRVSALFVYPVKSCRGIRVEESVLEPRGLRHDRRWMIVDEAGAFVTQRTAPRLAQVRTSLELDGLHLESDGMPSLVVPFVDSSHAVVGPERTSVRVWRDEVAAVDCGENASRWLTRWLGFPASLVFMPDDTRRPIDPTYARSNDIVSFADGFPVLVASSTSLDELNAQMATPVPMDRFRANIVVSGCLPWSEDSWARLRIGEAEIRIAKPCERCVVTTIDQCTAARGAEPMLALALSRRRDNAVLFGQNGVGEQTGTISVGNRVTVVRRA